MRKSLIKVITGQRRVGKSYLLFQLIGQITEEEPDANIIYINLEDFEFSRLQTAEDMHSYIVSKLSGERRNYIFIDEIQDVEHFERALRSLALEERNDIYITGSNSKMLSGELATYLSGRYVEFSVYSLSYPEFLLFHRLTDSGDSLELYTRFGGLPYLTHLPLEEETADEYLKSVYAAIVFRDVVMRYNLRNHAFLEKLVRFLAENIGNLFSAKNISDFLKSQHTTVSVNQIQSYTEYLSNAFLIHRVERYDMVGKRVFEIGEKYYFENLGLRNVVCGYRVDDKGKLMENLVYNHLLFLGYHAKVGYYGDKEIDFIAERNQERLYVQVSLRIDNKATADREFGNLIRVPDNYPKIVVTDVPFVGNTYKGISCLSLRQFLITQ